MEYRFAECQLSPEVRTLLRRGSPVRVQPLVFDLLLHLIRHRERVVTQAELQQCIWRGAQVSPAAIASAVRDARRATGDDGRRQHVIRTIPRVGFRFVSTVTEETLAGEPGRREQGSPLPGDRQRCEALIELGEQRTAGGRYHQGGRELLLRAAQLARRCGWPELLARAALGIGDPAHGIALGDTSLIALLEEACETLGPDQEVLRLRVAARLAAEKRQPPGVEETEAASGRERLGAGHRSGDAKTRAAALLSRALQRSGPDHLEERRAIAAELVEAGLAAQDATLESYGHHFLVSCALEAGRRDELDRAATGFARAAERTASSPFLELLTGFEAGRATWEGRLGTARSLVAQFASFAKESPLALIPINVRFLDLFLRWLRGDAITSRRLTALTGADLPEEYAIVSRCLAALVAAESGHPDWTHATYREVVDAQVPNNMFTLTVLFALGQLAAALRDASRAPRLIEAIEPYRDRVATAVGMHYQGSMCRPLGNLARVMGRSSEAVRLLAGAVALEQAMGARSVEALTRLDLARALTDEGSVAEARRELEVCRRLAGQLGMRRLVRQTSLAVDRLPASRSGAGLGGPPPRSG